MDPVLALRLLLVAAAIVGYYAFFVGRVGDAWAQAALRVALRSRRVATRYSVAEVDSVLRLTMAGLMQACFCGVLVVLSGQGMEWLVPHRPRPALLLLGAALGVGEAALGSYLGYTAMQVAAVVAPAKVPRTTEEWLASGRGGWMRLYLGTSRVVALPLLAALTFLYVGVEETIFRGVLVNLASPAGAAAAVGVSTALFVAVQCFHMPSWHAALFPVLGALAIGVVHGVLYLAVPDLQPLVVAHFVLFMSAVL